MPVTAVQGLAALYDQHERIPALDKLRGLAILLMVTDHLAWLVGDGPWWLRGVLTRPAMPLFMLIIGLCWRPGWRRRHVQLIEAAALTGVLTLLIGLAAPDVLVVIVLALPAVQLLHRVPLLGVGLGVVQAITWPIGWLGYEPGVVLALILTGIIAGQLHHGEHRAADRLPDLLARIGRYPLTWYVGHLLAVAVAWALLS